MDTTTIRETVKETVILLKTQGLIVGNDPYLRMSEICEELGEGKNWVIERILCVKIRGSRRTSCTLEELNIPRPIPVLHLPQGFKIRRSSLEKWRNDYEDHNKA